MGVSKNIHKCTFINNYDCISSRFEFHMTKAKFDGLNTFEILKSFYNKATGKFEMLFVMPKLSFEGVYSMLNKINTDYLDAKMINNGTVHFHMSDSAKYGFEFFFGTNKTTNDIMVEKFKFIYPEDMKSFEFDLSEEKKEYYEEFKEMLKQIEKEFDEMYNDYMAMRFNKIFAGYKTVEDLADYLYKMAGDEEHGLFNEPKCNHV